MLLIRVGFYVLYSYLHKKLKKIIRFIDAEDPTFLNQSVQSVWASNPNTKVDHSHLWRKIISTACICDPTRGRGLFQICRGNVTIFLLRTLKLRMWCFPPSCKPLQQDLKVMAKWKRTTSSAQNKKERGTLRLPNPHFSFFCTDKLCP